MFLVFWLLVALVGAGIQALLSRGHPGRGRGARLVLLWLLGVVFGAGGLVATVAHTAFAAKTAASIGWPAHNPFQFEVANANFAFAVLALVALRAGGGFRLAALLGNVLWLAGDGVGHIYQLVAHGDRAPNNAGVFLVAELGITVLTAVLTVVVARQEARARAAAPAPPRQPAGTAS